MDTANRFIIEKACERLAFQFCYLSDHRRHEEYADVFAADGVFSRPGLEARGRSEILEGARRRPDHLKTRHLCTNVIVSVVNETHATGTGIHLYVMHDASTKTTHPPIVVDFTDEYVRTADGWKIARRSVQQAF